MQPLGRGGQQYLKGNSMWAFIQQPCLWEFIQKRHIPKCRKTFVLGLLRDRKSLAATQGPSSFVDWWNEQQCGHIVEYYAARNHGWET